MIIIIIIVVFGIILLLNISDEQPYTNEEWDEQLSKDFEKYGPLPEDIDDNEKQIKTKTNDEN